MSKIDDGGPAFPASNVLSINIRGRVTNQGMNSCLVDHCRGFADHENPTAGGMSLRDYFAAHALAFLAHPARVGVTFDPKGDAEFAYAVADEMLAARKGDTQ